MRIYRVMLITGLLLSAVSAQDAVTFSKGVKRWSIKTSLLPGTISKPPVTVTFSKLRGLDSPAADLLQHPETRMRKAGESGLQEGDVVQTEGYVQLVALEASKKSDGTRTDGDYHIQVSDSRTDRDNVVIAEVPFADFVSGAQLKTKVDALRAKLRDKLHKGTEFSMNKGNCMVHPVRMRLIGQLFYDQTHSTSGDPGGGRGKQGHHAATLWEIHPLFSATFLDPKDPTRPALACP